MAHIFKINDKVPQIGEKVFLAPTASVTGDAVIHDDASLFYGVSVRADSAKVEVGGGTNLQDNVVVHADEGFPCTLGSGVSVGHAAVVHGATIGDNSLIGMSATVMNGAVVGRESLVAAGSLVLEGTEIPPRSLVAGSPAKFRRELTADEVSGLRSNAEVYLNLKELHRVATA